MSFAIRQIGNTDVHVTSVGFGCAPLGNLYQAYTDAECKGVLQAAWAAGIRYFDTAPHYGRGLAEQRLGQFLQTQTRDTYVVSTKVGRVQSPGEQHAEQDSFVNPLPNDQWYDYSGDGIEASLHTSRTRLGSKYLDIVFVHDIGGYTHGDANAAHMEALLGSGLERLVRLKERGEIGAIGLGVNENAICLEVMKQHPLDVILLAGRLTLLDRSAEEQLVPLCVKAGTSLVLGGVLNSGILASGAVEGATYDYQPASQEILSAVAELQAKADTIGVPLVTAALQYAQSHPSAAAVLIGTARAQQLSANIEALQTPLADDFHQVF